METKLSKIAHIAENTSLVILFRDISAVTEPLSQQEQELWQGKPDKTETVYIQRLPYFLYLVNPDFSRPQATLLESFRKAGASLMETVKKDKTDALTICGFSEPAHTMAFLEGLLLSAYSFSKYKKEKESGFIREIRVWDPGVTLRDLEEVEQVAGAVSWARDLVNEPFSGLNAAQMSEEFLRKGEESGFSVEIFRKQRIESLKMGGLLAVNQGSVDPPNFTVMEWKPENPVNSKPVVLVGKGVVFDTGGLSLKTTPKSMDFMKSDMAGAAAVAAILFLASRAALPVHLVGLVPATDNRLNGNALTPGDVITMMDGTTVEVLNTDAEGRLMLADALCYAKKYDPLLVIDLATLTGAASIIAGTQGILAMSNDKNSMIRLMESGEAVYERIIELPLWEEYGTSLRSDIADMTNLGGREGQTIVAAKFLEHFTDYPWIHLDIAGTAYLFEKEGYRVKGATGSGIRLLFNFLKNLK
jgi:leucyl aminopeptidase